MNTRKDEKEFWSKFHSHDFFRGSISQQFSVDQRASSDPIYRNKCTSPDPNELNNTQSTSFHILHGIMHEHNSYMSPPDNRAYILEITFSNVLCEWKYLNKNKLWLKHDGIIDHNSTWSLFHMWITNEYPQNHYLKLWSPPSHICISIRETMEYIRRDFRNWHTLTWTYLLNLCGINNFRLNDITTLNFVWIMIPRNCPNKYYTTFCEIRYSMQYIRSLWRQKQIFRTWIIDYTPQYSVDVITYPCPRYLLLAP